MKAGYQSTSNIADESYGGNQYPNQQQKQPQQANQRPYSYGSDDYNANRKQAPYSSQQGYESNYNQRNVSPNAAMSQNRSSQSNYDNAHSNMQERDYSNQRRPYSGNYQDSYTNQQQSSNQYNQSNQRPNRSSRPSILDESKGKPPNFTGGEQNWQQPQPSTNSYPQPNRNTERNNYSNGNGYDSNSYQNQNYSNQGYGGSQNKAYYDYKNPSSTADQSQQGYTAQYSYDSNANQGYSSYDQYDNNNQQYNQDYNDSNGGNQWDSYGNQQQQQQPQQKQTDNYVNSVLGHNLKNLQVYPLPADDPGETVGRSQVDSNYQQPSTTAGIRRSPRAGVDNKKSWNGGNSRSNLALNIEESETSDISNESPQHQPSYGGGRNKQPPTQGEGRPSQDRTIRVSKGATVSVGGNRGRDMNSGPSRTSDERPANSGMPPNRRSAANYQATTSTNQQDNPSNMEDYDNSVRPKPSARVSMKLRRPQQFYNQDNESGSNYDRDNQDYGRNDRERRNNAASQSRGGRISVAASSRRNNAPDDRYNEEMDNDNYNQSSNQADYNRRPSPNRGARVTTGPSNNVPRRPRNGGDNSDAPIPRPRTQSAKGKGSIRMR
ncbi:uncharacterized protein TRIADDRAFT_58711 [Trichoplax adhaerens]|uniref:Uncharacterized protein n=1 Tax=Trichoplax adhaerens TaxID=10228 RepID=B3S3G3_TRIAD|nr:hypothetical protein TRIADDRAFT_58711 [Trichoplax adhaerens]EDV22963.1 hypothetical protein TRIADDRAFT_58711 [Trichoplax adhaerens]|eukprot:XP_002114829.1 hypothetical protein TRIADDRAFT_58711 [Trichoplax adhaerens]